MLSRCLLLAFVATSCRSQYQMETDVRADITFNADNDRFDVANIIDEQKRVFNEMPSTMDGDMRRNFDPLTEVLKHNRLRYERAHKKSLRRAAADFAYHDIMLDETDYVDGQYDKNLEPLRIRTKSQRRNIENTPKFVHDKVIIRRSPDESKQREMKGLQNVVLDYLHGGKEVRNGRRTSVTNPEEEILLHYAVPLRMKVKGFLEMPRGPQSV